MKGNALTARQKWSQFGLGLAVPLPVVLALHFIGARAPWAAIPAVGLWMTPWIEFKTTGRQPKDLAFKQTAALGCSIGYIIFELTRW
ncbi:MAG: hypothetical protein M3R13_00700 [Armatimonadota bacterium]|nr:hypothetical protein [Armatimonadota bacterium]